MATNVEEQLGSKVCVIGAGVIGLATTKNLLEQGLDVTTFERHEHIGGTWHVSDNGEQTTALEQTKLNTSKQTCSYSDFPFPEELPMHPLAIDVQKYLESYAEHFNLMPHIELSTEVDRVERDEEAKKWLVYTKNAETGFHSCRHFDRVAVATGILNTKHVPKVRGIELFAGDAIHSRQFKDASKYTGKNVLVVGIGATGADSTSFLVRAKAAKVYLSHRSQFLLLPRLVKGKAFDHTMSRRVGIIVRAMLGAFPRVCSQLMTKALMGLRSKEWPWLTEHPSFTVPRKMDGFPHRVPAFSDDLADNLRDGHIETVLGIEEVTGPRSVTLTDGRVLEDIDAIIFCSGYFYDFSLVRGTGNPTDPAIAPDHHKEIQKTRFYDPQDKFPRLYRGFLSEQYPESLAFLGHMIIMKPPILLYDLISMALASLWTGGHAIESAEERRRDIDIQYRFVVSTLDQGPMHHLGFRLISAKTYDWLNRVAGTGLTELLGNCSWAACKLWWRDRKFYNLLMDGTDVPAVYRLFDMGHGRKPWPGAKERIEHVNAEVKALGEAWEQEKKKKKTN
ncbi:flavin-binding monooxygenase-like-domain-containing protein [Dactylonectria macrodidyma]|uniref:Flavin-binding monooxygenase-like-domain-containing protein n=1 Tax=Dactylonectria macrodidyma TaxID=307937 RepID=A0A9P9FN03_9HYPO|nr:flavin-binding monooxygenase-like-domain-containing protein [Dactylonectria macrodidyma]